MGRKAIDHHRCAQALIKLNVSDRELVEAPQGMDAETKPRYTRGVLAKYMKIVSTRAKAL